MEIFDRLKILRSKLRLKQKDLADILGIGNNAYSMIETGKTGLSKRNQLILCEILSINPLWLETGVEPMFLGKPEEIDTLINSIHKTTGYSKQWIETGMGRMVADSQTTYQKADVTDRFLVALELLKEKGISYTEVASKLGVSTSLVSEIRRGKAKLNPTHAQKFIEIFNINTNWLFYGKGNTTDIFNTPVKSNTHPADSEDTEWINVPFVPLHARATFAESFLDTNVKEIEIVKIQKRPGINYDRARVFEVDGDSMEPTLISGEQVLCEIVDPSNWRFLTGVVVVAFGNMVVIKRVKDNDLINGKLVLWSDNEQGGKITLSKDTDEIRRMYKVKYTVYKPIR